MRTILLAALALTFAATAAVADDRVPADSAVTRQKAVFVDNLVTKSVSARRIEQSGDRTAIAALEAARALVAEARSALDRGDYRGADAKLNEALGLVNAEVRRLSQSEVAGQHDKRMYERRKNDVTTFLAAYERVSGAGSGRAASQVREIRAHLSRAAAKAASGDYAGATSILDIAYAIARGDIREIRDGETLVRSLDFATAKEAYEYEIVRNASYFELLDVVIERNKPQGSMLTGIGRNREKAEALRQDAEKSARSGDHASGVKKLEKSTDQLRQAIRMAGLFLP